MYLVISCCILAQLLTARLSLYWNIKVIEVVLPLWKWIFRSGFVLMAANTFLLNHPPSHGPHTEHCFCGRCRNAEVDKTLYRRNLSAQTLHTAFFATLTQSRETMLDLQFELTKEEIILGYCFKRRCLEGTGYLSFGAWIANAPMMAHLTDVEKDVVSDKISEIQWFLKNGRQ